MANSQSGSTEEQSDLSDIKRKLAKRMGVAALMIVGLLGGLAVFDRLSAPNDTDSNNAPQFTEPVPVARKVQTQPVTPTEPVALPPKENKVAAEPEMTAPPVDKSGVVVGLPPPPEVMSQPVAAFPQQTQSVKPVQPAPAVQHPSGRASSGGVAGATTGAATPVPPAAEPLPAKATTKTVRSVEPIREPESANSPEPSRPAAVAKAQEPAKATRAVESSESPVVVAPPTSASTRLLSGYALQVGVFSDPRRAEELHAKLTQEGIPAFIEARVEVGPFKSKEEADAARARLNALGIESVMLSPKAKR